MSAPARLHLAFNLSSMHMNGRWRLPAGYDFSTLPGRFTLRE